MTANKRGHRWTVLLSDEEDAEFNAVVELLERNRADAFRYLIRRTRRELSGGRQESEGEDIGVTTTVTIG